MDDRRYSRYRDTTSKDRLVADLLRKTIENGATAGEEASAIQLAHMLVRQHGLDIDVFRACLELVGDPPRYVLTQDGFLVPTHLLRAADPAPGPAHGHDQGYGHGPGNHPRRRRTDQQHSSQYGGANPQDRCPVSPTGRHRMERYMRGTRATGAMYCLHCGFRTE